MLFTILLINTTSLYIYFCISFLLLEWKYFNCCSIFCLAVRPLISTSYPQAMTVFSPTLSQLSVNACPSLVYGFTFNTSLNNPISSSASKRRQPFILVACKRLTFRTRPQTNFCKELDASGI